MILETIVKPAGLRAPPKQRSVVQEDNCSKEILVLFEKYIKQVGSKSLEESYFIALGMVQHLNLPDQCCIDAFILHYQDDKKIIDSKTGLFVSALYNCLRQDVIVFDHDLPIDCLGFRLFQSKSLVVNGTAGVGCGYYSSGLVLVSGTVGDNCGFSSSGLVLVGGSAGKYCGSHSSGLVLVSGRAGDYCGFYSSGVVVECETGSVKDWGYSSKGLLIPYAELVGNQALHGYISNLVVSFTELPLGQDLPRPDVKSIIKNVRRLYNP